MDLFGPTFVSSLNHKWYCLVVTDDFSMFTWTFFLRTKDETSSILRNFITEMENLKDHKVKIIKCDNGREFKNKEINELYTIKVIKREFSNARTPQQNEVAEKRNRTLIEAARTMVFNKRTKKVEENMHVDFLENKLIKKGAGPNWLFDIDTLTNSMNYVPVVVVGTSSTNILAHIETKNSDGYNTDDPESSGISNPTATLKVPSAEQVEHAVSLTVETKIPIVSSPVPTVWLDISPKSSSDPRIISKGDFSQKETPYLGNALTLSNRFEDTFREEADLSNMETSIPVSPTPTFKIHKDHPKSQIIGPVNTHVQTRHMSKEMEEQSFIAIIHQKTNPDLLQFCLFSYLEFPDIVYKVEKAMYRLHQAPRSCITKKDVIFLLQDKYVDDILKKFGYSDVRSANTPMDKENPWGKDGPDIDYGGATQDRKSTTRGCQFLRRRLISWECKKQTILATSTTEAEYVAGASGCGQVLWIQNQMLDYGEVPVEQVMRSSVRGNHILCTTVLAFCDYHNMIAILEKTEHNIDFHQIVDFLEASHIRIETTNLETKILATVDGKPRTISESSLRRHLKLNDEEGIRTTFTHHAPSSPSHPTPTTEQISQSPTKTPTETPTLRRYTRRAIRIAHSKALSPATDEPASLLRDDRQGEAFPTVSSLDAGQDRENINKTPSLPYESSPRARVKFLEEKDKGSAEPTQEDAPIKRGIMETREEVGADKSTELGSNDTDEMIDALVARKMEEEFARENQRVNEQLASDSEIARLHVEEELKMMIEGLDMSNESKPLSNKDQREFYMSVLKSHAGWKTRHFRGMTLEEIKEKFIPVWKQLKDFVPMSSKKEGMMQLVPLEEVYVEALQFDREDLHQLWTLVKETLSIKPATKDKEKELWVEMKRLFEPDFKDQLWTHNQALMHDHLEWKLYDTCGVHHMFTKDHDIFMLVERDYPLRKGLVTVMICNKLQVEQYSQMANGLILKIHNITNSPR
nr:putative ribonuclease H-like domain-containing protein [Tanacetum cinerariifolium]